MRKLTICVAEYTYNEIKKDAAGCGMTPRQYIKGFINESFSRKAEKELQLCLSRLKNKQIK